MLVVVGAIFVSARRTMAPRTTAAETDETITPISASRKRWDTTNPSACIEIMLLFHLTIEGEL
jgi:hypothetical protein